MGTLPATGTSNAYARTVLGAEVKMAQYLFLESEGILMDRSGEPAFENSGVELLQAGA